MATTGRIIKITDVKLTIGERWLDSWLVTFPVSYAYNGGSEYIVDAPHVPAGFELVYIGTGLIFGGNVPYATRYLKPLNGKKVLKRELKALL